MAETSIALTAAHLQVALLPADLTAGAAADHYGRAIDRVDIQVSIADLWRRRVDLVPDPPAPATLAELVRSARQRLRRDRLGADRDELDARRFVLERVRSVLLP